MLFKDKWAHLIKVKTCTGTSLCMISHQFNSLVLFLETGSWKMPAPHSFTGIFHESDYVTGTGYVVKHPTLAIKQLCYRGNGCDYSLPSESH